MEMLKNTTIIELSHIEIFYFRLANVIFARSRIRIGSSLIDISSFSVCLNFVMHSDVAICLEYGHIL